MKNLLDKLYQLNGEELRDLLKKVEKVKSGKVVIAGPVSDDYEKYQLKNQPNTVDIAVTIVMGAPFPTDFRKSLKNLMAKLECILEPYDIALRMYAEHNVHATVSPIVRTTFDPDKYLKDPDTMNKIQRHEILNRELRLQQVKQEVRCTHPFSIEVCPWDIRTGKRGEILLWGSAKNDKGKKELRGLRKRLKRIAGSHARDKGSKVHIALATIKDFHKLTGLQKKDITWKLNSELEFISCPDSILIDRVKLVQYLHRSLSKVESLEEIRFC
jgi:hypothetical protein